LSDGPATIETDTGAAAAAARRAVQPTAQLGDEPGLSAVGAIFTGTTFLSALLLFSIQPMFAKMVLPKLGGAPSVWAVALLFFQGALLAGYCLAHLFIRYVPLRQTGFVHLALYALAALTLPFALPQWLGDPPPGDPYVWQLELFTVAIGLPFVAVAANAPLLQAWYSGTKASGARDPYFLYAASNLGSLIALLAYPLLLEPAFGLTRLASIWAGLFVVLAVALAACFVAVRRAGANRPPQPASTAEDWPPLVSGLKWAGLAAVPSALLTAFTTHVATDVASAPLIWVIPLALYLATFVVVFRDAELIPSRVLLLLHVAAATIALVHMAQMKHGSWVFSSLAGGAAFFTSCLVAHRTLYEARPPASQLTAFYLWMSLGGVLGGMFAALLAPKLFSEVLEYPLLIALSFACRPGALDAFRKRREAMWSLFLLALGVVLIFWLPWAADAQGITFKDFGTTAALAAALGIALVTAYGFPARQLALALALMLTVVWLPSAVHRGAAQRSYFGVYRVNQSEDGEWNVLTHGTTLHGAQRIRDAEGNPVGDTTPGTYYHPSSPMAQAIAKRREILAAKGTQGPARGRYGIVGLGAGTLSCLSEPGEHWRFFEIDPVVVDISRHGGNFTYLANCQPETDIVLGDARLTLAREADRSLDLLILDAFTSDAVPVHLMTADALKLYAAKLTDDGIAVLHVSNRYLDLEGVLAATVPAATVPAAAGTDAPLHGLVVSDDTADGSYASTTSTIVIVAKSEEVLQPYRALKDAEDLVDKGLKPWTDDYSDILGPFLAKRRK
jgi:hypothetical protein